MKENRADEFVAVLVLFLPVCIIAISLRCYCRLFLVKCFGLDDWFAVLAVVGLPLLNMSFSSSTPMLITLASFSIYFSILLLSLESTMELDVCSISFPKGTFP